MEDLNENVFDMPSDVEEAENVASRRAEGRRLAQSRLFALQNSLPKETLNAIQEQCIYEAAIASSNTGRIADLERQLQQANGQIAGLKFQLEETKSVPEGGEGELEKARDALIASGDAISALQRVIHALMPARR